MQHYKVERARDARRLKFIPPHIRAEDLVSNNPNFYRRVHEIKDSRGVTDNEAIRMALLEERGNLWRRMQQQAETAASRFRMFDAKAQAGLYGICMIGKSPQGTFKEAQYLCADGWSGRQGASVARAGAPPDPTPEELKDRLGDPIIPPQGGGRAA
jgi:hypothetical protein